MWTRRSVLRLAGSATGAAFAARSYGIDYVAAATAAVENRSPEDVAADETYWREIQMRVHARPLDDQPEQRQLSARAPRVVHEAYKRYLDSSNQAPVYHRGLIERNIETARRRLAAEFGADPGGDRHHAQRQRVAADRAERPRSRSRATRSSRPSRTTAAC